MSLSFNTALSSEGTLSSKVVIALSKGRIFEETRPLLSAIGIEMNEDDVAGRQLRIESNCGHYSLLILRATDVPVFVSYGAADLGVVGKDVLMEQSPVDVYEPLDLKIANCRLMVAEPLKAPAGCSFRGVKRVATKYLNVADEYFASRSIQVELIKLYGSMELAPVVGLADAIVDVVDTGRTLAANGLKPTELIAQISSRLIVNKSAMKRKHSAIQKVVVGLEKVLAKQDQQS